MKVEDVKRRVAEIQSTSGDPMSFTGELRVRIVYRLRAL